MSEYRTEYREKRTGEDWTMLWEAWDDFPCSPDGAWDAAINAYFGHPRSDKKARLTVRDRGTTAQFRLRKP